MAAKAWLSILGLYRMNPNLFSEMNLPTGVDETILQNEIMEECAELEILFPDPAFMQKSLGWWTTSRSQAWEKMAEALAAKYNPIWNKDGKKVESREMGAQRFTSGSQSFTTGEGSIIYGEDKTTYGERESNDKKSVSGYNSNTLNDSENIQHTEEEATDTRAERTDRTAERVDSSGPRTDTTDAHKDIITVLEQGNIGVTESSTMVQHELDLRRGPTIYQIIVEEFKAKYCLLVY